MRVLFIDNYDSFTYNLVHYVGELGADVEVVRNDQISAEQIRAQNPEAIILSPGPCTPTEAGVCVPAVSALSGQIPIFGVCLGLQSVGQAFGGQIVRADRLMHGKVSSIEHSGKGVFKGLPSPFEATRYHSLVIKPESLPATLEITATADNGVIMGIQHKTLPVHGVQFHPESIASEHGRDILRNFLDIARNYNLGRAA